jgi:xylan 1,4-beta-xylosidase
MGYRFALFNYATESAGGFVDFDFFSVDNKLASPSSAGVNNIVCNPDGSVTL